MDSNLLILLFFIIFVIHNFEEIIFIEPWFKKTFPKVEKRVPAFAIDELNKFKTMTSQKFSIVVCLLTIVVSIILLISITTDYFFLFFGTNLFFSINILTHPIQSIILRSYVPGVLTSVLLILPFNILLFYYLYSNDILNGKLFINSLSVGLFLIPAFLIGHWLGEKWSYK